MTDSRTTGEHVRALADEVHAAVLARAPFLATELGVPGHDREVPDLTEAAERAYGERVRGLRDRALAVDAAALAPADRVSHAAVVHATGAQLAELDSRTVEHTVTAMFGDGPGALFALAGRTRLTDAEHAEDHLARTRAFPAYLQAHVARLQQGAAAGRSPVRTLRDIALGQVDAYLAGGGPDALAGVAPPEAWEGAQDWSRRLDDVVRQDVRPALQRWRDAVAALPTRPDERCGLVHLPGGAADYDRLVALHTTLPLTAAEVHALGLRAVGELQEQMTALGGELGLTGFPAVRDAVRSSGAGTDPETAMAGAREAVRRAEDAVPAVFPLPLPPPCRVAPMSEHLGRVGVPPHYTPPKPDGTLGTYWFNAQQPGAGSGWDLEATAFHEAVPGHHLQLSRAQGLTDVPALQAQGLVTAHAEGWGLYAEVLAGELGLYSGPQARLGALGVQLFRAARLVVDTGLHARGWSRQEALTWFADTVPLPEAFTTSEVNRYIAMPGQALAYLVGLRELLRLREDARSRLAERFELAGFHAAVLDSGSLPLPAVAVAVDAWVAHRAQRATA